MRYSALPIFCLQEDSKILGDKKEIYMKWKMNTHSGDQRIYNYAVHILLPQNTKNGEPELKIIG